ncbi:tyrosine-protein phosphatase non-receptor type 3-like isoform X7 [Tachypleus tridentatus]|uniref:tyrosine-protein phosphatase non-receptor type 3-like isoform X7 n=1 Tax=Tachypleus tridentatus TaxID=6853 RepID=UPI003FCFA551
MWKYVEQFVCSLLNCHTGSKQTTSRTIQTHQENNDGIVSVKMKADSQRLFGFKFKGGSGENSPVVVSSVLRKSPADTCLPRLNEGDEILSINNNDVRALKPEQIEKLIQAAADTRVKELCLRVRQRIFFVFVVYDIEEGKNTLISQVSKRKYLSLPLLRCDTLNESIALITEGLKDESLILKFESIPRRQSGETNNIAKLPENVQKNRYKDVSPYDTTRVVLEDCLTGDYINASNINMVIPTLNIVNRYIATQGPLSTTCIEFWQTNTETNVNQMQYIAWPDHGVPIDASDFLSFVWKVREYRDVVNVPTIVHCSAGIGRTGVLILMETAMSLIEANKPVYPLEIVQEMRRQRPMLIQTTASLKNIYYFTRE